MLVYITVRGTKKKSLPLQKSKLISFCKIFIEHRIILMNPHHILWIYGVYLNDIPNYFL